MQKKSLKSVWLILFISLTSGCGHVPIKDSEVCGDMGDSGASCFHTLKPDTRDIPKDAWDAERFGMLCTKSENYANWKASIEKLCALTKACTYQEKQALEALGKRIDAVTHLTE